MNDKILHGFDIRWLPKRSLMRRITTYELGDLQFNEEQRTAWKILFEQMIYMREKMAASKPLIDEDKKLIQDTY